MLYSFSHMLVEYELFRKTWAEKLALQRRRDAPDGPLDPRLKIGRGKLYTDQRLCKRRNIAELRIKQPPTQLSP